MVEIKTLLDLIQLYAVRLFMTPYPCRKQGLALIWKKLENRNESFQIVDIRFRIVQNCSIPTANADAVVYQLQDHTHMRQPRSEVNQ